jgi:uncharacterized protein (DUF362 family)
MKIHPLLQDPNSVFIARLPVPEVVGWGDFHRAAAHALDAMRVELDGEKAVFKPNVTIGEKFADPDTGITTHPGFVHGMIDYLRQHGARKDRFTIIEDPRNTDDHQPRHWRGTGYDRLAQQPGVGLHCPSSYTCVKKVVPHPQTHPLLNVSRLAVDPHTVLFNVPKLKTHNLAITTLCLKNLMGLVNVYDRHYCVQAWQEMPEPARSDPRPRVEWFERPLHEVWQAGLARRLVDTAQVIQPALNVVEGVVGRDGTGFQRGANYALGLVVAGVNMVAVDSVASYLMGFDPQKLVYLQIAADAGLGQHDPSRLNIYRESEGELVPCRDLVALRLDPPFRVISNIKEEAPVPA